MDRPATSPTREAWLLAVADKMAPLFADHNTPLPRLRMSIGFTSRGPRGKTIGQCWSDKASADKTFEIFIDPRSDAPALWKSGAWRAGR